MTEEVESLEATLLNSSGSNFFELLEKHLKTKIPAIIKNNLLLAEYNSAIVLCKLDETTVSSIEDDLRNNFDNELMLDGETIEDYFGRFAKCRDKFRFMSGHKQWFNIISDTCKRLMGESIGPAPPATVENTVEDPNKVTLNDDNIQDLKALIFKWIHSHNAFSQAFVDRSSNKILIKCPVKDCNHSVWTTFQRYARYYKTKNRRSTSLSNAKWTVFGLQRHILMSHKFVEKSDRESRHGSSENHEDETFDNTSLNLESGNGNNDYFSESHNEEVNHLLTIEEENLTPRIHAILGSAGAQSQTHTRKRKLRNSRLPPKRCRL
ncbi:hypothetical protein Bhyg_07024 [Pseudolycoriella hygida]|uniref:Transposase-associated domain-containing protein n=1 Tax=Pseudolycoriella hygida TaxID=35572 RepID=A0A9Q0N1T0_9DIPT|nr:hypothetical protein Bhyg_07024 [Pseudolycoriella hygida]